MGGPGRGEGVWLAPGLEEIMPGHARPFDVDPDPDTAGHAHGNAYGKHAYAPRAAAADIGGGGGVVVEYLRWNWCVVGSYTAASTVHVHQPAQAASLFFRIDEHPIHTSAIVADRLPSRPQAILW